MSDRVVAADAHATRRARRAVTDDYECLSATILEERLLDVHGIQEPTTVRVHLFPTEPTQRLDTLHALPHRPLGLERIDAPRAGVEAIQHAIRDEAVQPCGEVDPFVRLGHLCVGREVFDGAEGKGV